MNPGPRPLILVVEDDEAVRRTLVDMLEANGFRTSEAGGGAEGFAAAKREMPAVILTDIAMPGVSGLELLKSLGRDPELRAVPAIVISAGADRAAVRQGMELGAADYITKPFSEIEVMHSIAARLEHKALLDELDAFAHTAAHDLRNPLATLSGRLELAELALAKADAAAAGRHLAAARSSAGRLQGIIDELLVLSGVRREAVVPAALEMSAIVEEAVERLESLLQRQEAVVRRPEQWPVAFGHAPWVVEIWANLISNAAIHGGAKPQIALGGQPSADRRTVRFWVQDGGPGLDEAVRQKVFVPFTQIATARHGSHGLGLSIVRRIAEKLGGRVGVESTPGSGALFWFELPCGAPAPADSRNPAMPPLLFAP